MRVIWLRISEWRNDLEGFMPDASQEQAPDDSTPGAAARLKRTDLPAAGRLFEVRCAPPLLVASFDRPQTFLSWALARPGRQAGRRVAWLEVRDADLPIGLDPAALLAARLDADGLGDAVAMMTSRDVRKRKGAFAAAGTVSAQCLATTGLSNAARVGAPSRTSPRLGTINVLAAVSAALSEAALIEAVSIAAEARTAAVMDAGWPAAGGVVTGTGTDCIVVAAPAGGERAAFAGLHTDIGQALGSVVYQAVHAGATEWVAEQRDKSG